MSNPLRLLWPVSQNATVTQTFAEHVQRAQQNGWCSKPGNCPSGTYYYGGVDFGIPTGTPIDAPMSGRAEVQNQGVAGYGLNLRITGKDGYVVILAHLLSTVYRTGDDVRAGEICAMSDNTGNSTGPHLHFELRHNGVPIDPMPYLIGEVDPDTEPVPPPALADMVKIGSVYRAVGIRTAPSVDDSNLILRVNGLGSRLRFQRRGELHANGHTWTEVVCYIASEFLESA